MISSLIISYLSLTPIYACVVVCCIVWIVSSYSFVSSISPLVHLSLVRFLNKICRMIFIRSFPFIHSLSHLSLFHPLILTISCDILFETWVGAIFGVVCRVTKFYRSHSFQVWEMICFQAAQTNEQLGALWDFNCCTCSCGLEKSINEVSEIYDLVENLSQ